MPGDLKIYDADQMNVSLAAIPLGGYAEDEFLVIERESPAFTDVAGVDSEVTRSKTNDHRATIRIRLMSTSDSNDLLSALYNSDRNTPGGVGVGAFMARDNQGRAVFSAEKAWISEPPNPTFARAATEREWVLRAAYLIEIHGGS